MVIKINRKSVQPIINLTYPEYKGHKVSIEAQESITFYDCNWSGGTRNEYKAICDDGRLGTLPTPAPWNNPHEGQKADMTPHMIIVERSYFCGHDLGIRIHVHPSHMPKYLQESKR